MPASDLLPAFPAFIANRMLDDLRAILPRPIPDTPENRDIRDRAALAAVKALSPTNAADAMHATLIVAFEAAAKDSQRMADGMGHDVPMAARLRRLADQLMRQAQSSRKLLRKWQAGAAAHPRPRFCPAARAEQERIARLRASDLRLIETSPTLH